MTPQRAAALIIFIMACFAPIGLGCAKESGRDNIVASEYRQNQDIQAKDASLQENNAQNEQDIGEEDASMHGTGGGTYSSHWTESETVESIADHELVLTTEEGNTLAIDTARAEKQGRCLVQIDVGDEISVEYFLYDRTENSIIADAIVAKSTH